MCPVPVKFSWFLSEFIVLKVEIEDRNLVSALLRKILGSDGKNKDFRFNYTPECMVSRMHFKTFFGDGSPSVSADFYPRSISGCAFDLGFFLNSRAPQCAIDRLNRFGFLPQFTPPTCLLTPRSPNEGDFEHCSQPQLLVFPNTAEPKISFQEYVVRLKYTIEKLLTAGWENFLK